MRNLIALRRWPPRSPQIEPRRGGRAAPRTSRLPRIRLGAWFWQRVHVALERARRRERFWERIQLELEKARRHDRRFVLARLRFDVDAGGPDDLAAELGQGLRYEDAVLVGDGSPGEVLVLLSETDGPASRQALERLERQYGAVRLRTAAIVVFPSDGLTRSALIDALSAPVDPAAHVHDVRPHREHAGPNPVTGA